MKHSYIITICILINFFITGCNDKKNNNIESPTPINGEIITNVGEKNTFTTSDAVLLNADDVANLNSIRRVEYTSKDINLISTSFAYIFDFKYTPQKFDYQVLIPKTDEGKALVMEYGDGSVEVPQSLEDGIIKASVSTNFFTIKSEYQLSEFALLNKSQMVKSYQIVI